MYQLRFMLIFSLIYFSFLYLVSSNREKRTLIYPPPKSKIQFIYGIGLPIALEDISVVRGYVIKANYYLPFDAWNITHPETIIMRKKRDTQLRWNIYSLFSNFLDRYGGRSCILKTICEFSELDINKSGFFEQIFHLLFRPSSTKDKILNTSDKEYLSAEKFGQSRRGLCGIIYSDCTISLLKYFLR